MTVSLQQKAWEKAHDEYFKALKKGDTKRLDEILFAFPDAKEWKTNKDVYALHIAILKNDTKLLTYLLDKGYDIHRCSKFWDGDIFVPSRWNEYPIETAVKKGRVDCAFLLIERGAHLSQTHITRRNRKQMKLLEERQKLIRQDFIDRQRNITPPIPALSESKKIGIFGKIFGNNTEKSIDELLATEASWDKISPHLFKAIMKEDLPGITAIYNKFPDCETWSQKDTRPLFYAMKKRKLESFRHMLTLGMNADLRKTEQKSSPTLLHFAVYHNLADYCHELIIHGADPQMKAGWFEGTFDTSFSPCERAVDIARQRGNTSLIPILERAELTRSEYLEKQKTAKPPLPPAPVKKAEPAAEPDLLKKFNDLVKKQEQTEKTLQKALEKIDALEKELQPKEMPVIRKEDLGFKGTQPR